MTPSELQVPAPDASLSHRTCGGPPFKSIFFSFPSAVKARYRPSGDQKGAPERSVPLRARGISVSSDRTYSNDVVADAFGVAINAMRRPSGERLALSILIVFSGAGRLKVVSDCCAGASRKCTRDTANAASANTVTAIQSHGAVFRGGADGGA